MNNRSFNTSLILLFNYADRQSHEKDNITSPGDQSNNVNDTGSPAGTPPSDRNNTRTDGNQPARLPDSPVPGLLHDVLQSYLIGQQKTSQFLIGQNPSSIKSQKDLIGQLPNESNDESSILESEKGQTLTEKDLEVLNFENLIIESETDPNKSSYVTEKTSDTHKVVPGSIETVVNNSHLSQATCEGDLSNDQVGDKNVNKQGNRGEKLHLETSTAVKGDTVINNNPCSDNNLYLTNKPLSELNVKSKCLSFGHTRHSLGEDKFSTPGRKLNSDTTNTATAVQHRSSTLEFYEEKALRNASKSFEASKLLKHDFSDLSSYYTAHSDFGSDFYGFSASSFVTCQEFLTSGPKSRFTKAKEIFLQGRKYVKAKFSNYQKRLRSSHSARNRKCGATCGFPCFFLGREVSQFSFGIPECSLVKGNNHDNIEEKGDYSKCNNDLSDEEEEFFTSDNITMSENYKIPENHMINHVTNINGFQDGCSGLENRPDNSFKEGILSKYIFHVI